MTSSPADPAERNRLARLERNAQGHCHDQAMEDWLHLRADDPAEYDRRVAAMTPSFRAAHVQRLRMYCDLRSHHQAAVAAGVVPADDAQ